MIASSRIARLSFLPALLALALPAAAMFDDFESGDLTRWRTATTGSMTATVNPHNGSKMATLQHSGVNRSALSIDFPYSSSGYVSFDMQALPVRVSGMFGRVLEAGGGITITFSNAFNVVLGTVGFHNVTNPAVLRANEFQIDGAQHNYNSTMGELAALAKLPPGSQIAKVNLSFVAWGEFQSGGNIYPNYASSTTVWFDNVAVTDFDTQIECLLNWAERTYPTALAPSGSGTRFLAPYTYRYYGFTDAYVGVSTQDGHVYFLGADRVMADLGTLGTWLAAAGCRQ